MEIDLGGLDRDLFTIYWDASVQELPESLGGGKELNLTFFSKKERDDLQEFKFTGQQFFDDFSYDMFELAEKFGVDGNWQTEDDDDTLHEKDFIVYEKLKALGKIEELVCEIMNSGSLDGEDIMVELEIEACKLEKIKAICPPPEEHSCIYYDESEKAFIVEFHDPEKKIVMKGVMDWNQFSSDELMDIYNLMYMSREDAVPDTPEYKLICNLYADLRDNQHLFM